MGLPRGAVVNKLMLTNQEFINCPNCGATISKGHSNKCEYCNSTIVTDSKEFVMSKKKCVNQRLI